MLFLKNRVTEDLERIRISNLNSKQLKANNQIMNKHEYKEKLKLEKNDILAMMLAIFSLIMPYILVFIAIMSSIVTLLYYFILR